MANRYLNRLMVGSCIVCMLLTYPCASPLAHGQTPDQVAPPSMQVLPKEQWDAVKQSSDRGLAWLAKQQRKDGSFPSRSTGQPGVTSLCVMAFVSHGHLPDEGPYGKQLSKAIEYILSTQKRNGIFSVAMREGPLVMGSGGGDHTIIYNHAITSLLLSEVYGCGGYDTPQMKVAIRKSLDATHTMQDWKKRQQLDEGGWRYLHHYQDKRDSDLSVTGWCLMFLRSAQNAGFEVPEDRIRRAVKYIDACYQPRRNTFLLFAPQPGQRDRRSRGMAGAGILALAHAGLHETPEAQAAGDWLLKHSYPNYNQTEHFGKPTWPDDRYHYGLLLANQAMFQLGGKYWRQFFPQTVSVLLASQQQTGCWDSENHTFDKQFGNSYTTALMIITLGAPNQLLPIFQR